MERPVPHDVPLFPRHQPRPHCGRLPLGEVTVHVSAAEHRDRGVREDLESPEPPDGEPGVEIPQGRESPRVAEVDEVKLAVEAAECVPGLSLVPGHIVVDPHLIIIKQTINLM